MVSDLADALVKHGHHVTVITGFPNHPSGVVFGGYRKRWCLKEKLHGFDVRRMYLYTAPRAGKFRRILNFLSFTLTSAWALLTLRRYDILFAVFQPLSVGVTLPAIAKLRGAKLILNVQDLHPDVPVELGLVRNPLLIGILRRVEAYGYRHAHGLAVICDQFRNHCVARGALPDRVAVIPNWIALDEVMPRERNNRFRAILGLAEEHIVVLYAGTIGMVAGAEVVLHAARYLGERLPNLRFVFVGEGPVVGKLQGFAIDHRLNNVVFAPFQPRDVLSDVQAIADLSLVTLLRGKGAYSVPSKVLGYMAAGRPVIASVDSESETANLVLKADCGCVVEPENASALAEMIALLAADQKRRVQLGTNGRSYLEANYGKKQVTAQYVKFIEKVAGEV
jgi:glycosyltransferase involved in cell wall biosynthesis